MNNGDTDRALQDDVIRALADASFRGSDEWSARKLADPARVEKFARFLARHFYYERIVHFFKYSASLAHITGRRPEGVLAGERFNKLLPSLVLGSRISALKVAAEVIGHVLSKEDAWQIDYLTDLLKYETAMMFAEAGPRVWRDSQPTAGVMNLDDSVVNRGQNAEVLELDYDVTAVLAELLTRRSVLEAPKTPTRLLVSRSPHGRVVVAKSDASIDKLLALADEGKTFKEMRQASGLSSGELRETLSDLAEWGAVQMSVGS